MLQTTDSNRQNWLFNLW